jgi:hypothetical protein
MRARIAHLVYLVALGIAMAGWLWLISGLSS